MAGKRLSPSDIMAWKTEVPYPKPLTITGSIDFSHAAAHLAKIPDGTHVDGSLTCGADTAALPADLDIDGDLYIHPAARIRRLAAIRVAGTLSAAGTKIRSLSDQTIVGGDLNLTDCLHLQRLAAVTVRGSVWLEAAAVEYIDPDVKIDGNLDISHCDRLGHVPDLAVGGYVDISSSAVGSLHAGLTVGASLLAAYCVRLKRLPGLLVGDDVILRETQIEDIDPSLNARNLIVAADDALAHAAPRLERRPPPDKSRTVPWHAYTKTERLAFADALRNHWDDRGARRP